MMTLTGKVAVVTGAGQGLGRAEALALAAEGAHVVVNDVSLINAQAVVEEIIAAGGAASANSDDIADWEGGQRLISQAVAIGGHLDILLCNAGIVRDRMLVNMTADEWDAVIRVHLRGHFVPIRFAAEHWRARFKETGHSVDARLLTTTSEAGFYGTPGQSNYSAAKGGIVSLTLTAARELERFGVTANVISPRGRTPMTATAFEVEVPEGTFDEWDPANIGPWIAFLASADGRGINGQVFVTFGGTVRLMQGWSAESEIIADHRWTQNELRSPTGAERMIPGLVAPVADFPDIIPVSTK